MKLQVKPPEKTKTKIKRKASPPPSFSLLPDEIALTCFARIPMSYYSSLSIVSKSFRSLLSSTELYAARSHLGITEQCLYVCLRDRYFAKYQWFRFWINPNRALTNSGIMVQNLNLHLDFTSAAKSTVVVGSEIYVIGGQAASSAMRILDCRTHTWRDAPSMNVAREYSSSCVYNGKIYVVGGCKDEPWAEVFDTKTQIWERLPDPGTEIRKRNINIMKVIKGKIYVGNVDKLYAYDTKQGKWESCENKIATFPKSGCVIENVLYFVDDSPTRCYWYDIKSGNEKQVQGLGYSLPCKYNRCKLVSYGGKLLLIWEEYYWKGGYQNRILCAEIMVEKREGGEVWGKVEWTDVVHTIPSSCDLVDCLFVSI